MQAETGVTLYEHESLIIFDEVQLFPKARQAIKHLVSDGRYHYLETGSLISIKKVFQKCAQHLFDVAERCWKRRESIVQTVLYDAIFDKSVTGI